MKIKKLNLVVKKIFKKYGLNLTDAKTCTDALINAELVGSPSHGLSRLKMYCDRISKKVINPRAKVKIKICKTRISLTFNKYDGINFVFKDIENNDNFFIMKNVSTQFN